MVVVFAQTAAAFAAVAASAKAVAAASPPTSDSSGGAAATPLLPNVLEMLRDLPQLPIVHHRCALCLFLLFLTGYINDCFTFGVLVVVPQLAFLPYGVLVHRGVHGQLAPLV